MKIIITGGCGFIGSHVVNKLSEQHEVLVIDNLSSGKKENVSCKFIEADITNKGEMKRTFLEFKPEIVIHMAAQIEVRKSLKDPFFDAEQNIFGTLSVLEATRNAGTVKKFIYTSTGGARYGEPEQLPAKETDSINPLSPYGVSKHAAEHYVQMYGEMYGFDYLILCFGNVYGPGNNPSLNAVITTFIVKLLKKESPEIYGDGEQTRDFLFVDDVVKVINDNLEKSSLHKLFNLGSGIQVSVNDIYEEIEKILKTGIKPINKSAIEGEVRDIKLDIDLATNELDFKPILLQEGLKKTIDWFKSNS